MQLDMQRVILVNECVLILSSIFDLLLFNLK
jgi:hypothetical protein